ncbi:RHS repeat-associated core domain-containing protein [Parafilimonas terrae]|uniref:RHS repeat-associated core domain-containing protein n=2 Tax=Parafilimonas terrae TaxID=1465490 RepID=A0A1I5XH64_9BACT|nr:RHS repeat-associated core domain-containing protein [Parafilimonas terrae]
MGNVDTLVQDFTFNNGNRYFKKVIYNYDLISGKVNSIAYQKGQPDVFYHRYTYDFANKLTNAETSTDSITWENDAFYNYYAHGPLARMVVGEQQVQGMDYAYTLQGWLKGVNSTSPGTKFDIGADGRAAEYAPNAMIGRDVFGLALYYYGQSDYSAIKRSALLQPFANADPLNASFSPLYNGNIAAMSTNFNDVPVNGTNIKPVLYAYQYDQLNRLVQMRAFKSSIGFTNVSNIWAPVAVDDFGEDAAYDANGNITRYRRYGSKNVNLVSATVMDSLSYKYNAGTNQLNYIKDKIGVNAYTTDIDNQSANNYSYDAIGNLTADVKEGISSIEWTVYGKIKTINKTDGTTITYKYDAAGNRVSKTVGDVETWYVRDASGNILSIYTAGDASVNSGHLTWTEADIYGSSRLGTFTPNKDMTVTPPALEDLPTLGEVGYFATFTRGQKHYELTNHLGNVLAVISDKKIQVSSDNVTVSFCKAYIESANDYYPGGMQMPMRAYTASSSLSYRYGFNGKEKDNEVKGEGNQYDYGFRIYDPRTGRFLSVDPLFQSYPWYTPYQFAGNKPIWAIDLDGLEEKTSTNKGLTFFPILTPVKARTAGQMMSQQFSKSAQAFSESRTGKFIGGAWNFTTGTIGALASVSYISATDGAGAAVGGVVALQFSFGEMSIGTAQMMDALFSKKTNDVLQNSGSIPGLIAYGTGSKYAPFIDALGQFTPTLSTAGSLNGLVNSGLGIIDAAKTLNNTPTIANTIALLDQISDTKGFVLESFNLANDASGGKLKQSLSYAFSYTVQQGDNLTSIADKFHTTVETIAKDNGIKDINKINEGQSLKFSGYAKGTSGGAGSSDNY